MIEELPSSNRPPYVNTLLEIWEDSVRNTHPFLNESDILKLKPFVHQGLQEVQRLFIIREKNHIIGFMGTDKNFLEMLFLKNSSRGKGFGKEAIKFALHELHLTALDVNEQNPSARCFYEKSGFAIRARSELDSQGNPFPILHMSLKIIETPRLYLREMTVDDFPVLSDMLQDSVVMTAWERTYSDSEVLSWIQRNIKRYRENGYGYWLAIDKQLNEAVGQIGLLNEEINGEICLGAGWILRRKFWGKGYAAEGGKGLLSYAGERLNATKVIADIRPSNTASRAVAERLGMVCNGAYDKPVDGKIMPHLLYTINPRHTLHL